MTELGFIFYIHDLEYAKVLYKQECTLKVLLVHPRPLAHPAHPKCANSMRMQNLYL